MISITQSSEHFLIQIEKDAIEKDTFLKFVDALKTELLAQKVNFGKEIEDLGEELQSDWWEKNKNRFIPENQ